ncbi:hypothetical protein Agabi119p4_11271 [Agaricus bisporus var. burnettii]|uniref:DUF6533 domain-containing protein n=1 Tax=Agaricus bisporus var. burnettii TaxID=192524 RepID=A0A8H7C239_AGABI|nr:hypothetical protein Agabi119p4_11271 [Agaricus bisporus var. burnettii]
MVRQYTNIAGLVLLVYEQIITWDREVNRIWRSSDRILKMMFFLGRYWALAIQIINMIVTHPYVLEKPVMDCHKWFGFQTSAVGLLLLNLRLVFMLRVYALYDRSAKIAAFLLCGFIFYTAVMAFVGSRLVPPLKFNSSCMVMGPPDSKTAIFFTVRCHTPGLVYKSNLTPSYARFFVVLSCDILSIYCPYTLFIDGRPNWTCYVLPFLLRTICLDMQNDTQHAWTEQFRQFIKH